MALPSWLRILRFRKDKGYGLTFSYLIGALRSPIGAIDSDEQRCFVEFEALVHSMTAFESPNHTVLVRPCETGEPIAAWFPRKLYAGWDETGDEPTPSFQVEHYLPLGELKRNAAQYLWPHCKAHILSGNFSFDERAHVYRPFVLSERDEIARALADENDESDARMR